MTCYGSAAAAVRRRTGLGASISGIAKTSLREQPIADRRGAHVMDSVDDGVPMLGQHDIVAIVAVIADREHLPAGNHVRSLCQPSKMASNRIDPVIVNDLECLPTVPMEGT